MDKCIMIGCDLHDRSLMLKIATGPEKPAKRSFSNDPDGRAAMLADLRRRARAAGAGRIVFAYEASGLGFGLHDELTAAGIECYVLAPTLIARSPKHAKRKTDERDAQRILEVVRGWLLAGNQLPSVWVPDLQTRDDRELVRMRLTMGEKITRCKNQVGCLLKRNNAPRSPVRRWTGEYYLWLDHLCNGALGAGAVAALRSLLRQLEYLYQERAVLDEQVSRLSRSERYAVPAAALIQRFKGVGVLTTMVFLTEIGDLRRFTNRGQIGSFLGLTPTSQESGEADDRKGRISHQGSPRLRKVLNQAVWAMIRSDGQAAAKYERIAHKNPKHKKKAVVATMRDLGIAMWHTALDARAA